MDVAVVGMGYVGLATAALWAPCHRVTALDVVQARVDAVNACMCPFNDSLITARLHELEERGHALTAALNVDGALRGFDVVIVAVPTDYSEELGRFDTHLVDDVFAQIARDCPQATVVLRSTVQPGATDALAKAHGLGHVVYSPEFLREGRSLEDCLRPARVIVGTQDDDLAQTYREWLEEVYRANDVAVPPVALCTCEEAETAKLFANAYLATRVAFFNELDSFALHRGLDAGRVVQMVSMDARIGDHYNNPSFGYGGYCLPKDTKALLASFGDDVPHDVLAAVVSANDARKADLVDTVLATGARRVGVYRLVAKSGSDNLRSSALLDVVRLLVDRGASVIVYEPLVGSELEGVELASSVEELARHCDVLLANRMTPELEPYAAQVFTRDLYRRD